MTQTSDYRKDDLKVAFGWIGAVFAGFLVFVLIIGVAWLGIGAFGRYQARHNRSQDRNQALLDARNKVRVSNIEIQNQAQRVKVTEQQAEIRLKRAVGIREAQDEIAKTLTPLYVQFEMTDALKQIAKSGKNNSVVYLPSGANGIPLVATVNPGQVTAPDGK